MSELKPTPNKLSLTKKSLIALGTMAVINISYTGINNQNKTPDSNQTRAMASSLVEDATDDINAALNNSYPLWKACNFETRPQSEWGKEMEECGKELRWTQEEIDYENRMNSEAFAMLFLFFLDIVPTRPSVASLESAASRISKTPKQSATFKSAATGERITLRTKSTPAGETLEARVTKRNGQTTTKNEPINRSKNNKNNNPSNKSPREIEGVPCIASTIPNIPNNSLLASSNLNNSNSNNIDQFIQRLRAKYNLVKEGQMPIDVAMGLMEVAEAKNCYKVPKEAREKLSQIENVEGEMLGGKSKLADNQSNTTGKSIDFKIGEYKTWRVDVENPNPGVRAGQVHIQPNMKGQSVPKYYFSPVDKALYELVGNEFVIAPRSVQNLLGNTTIQKAINKGLEYLVEPTVKF